MVESPRTDPGRSWRAVVDALPDPVVVLSPVTDEVGMVVDLVYVAVNPAGASPLAADEMPGRGVRELWPAPMADVLVRWAQELLTTGRPLVRDDVEVPPELSRAAAWIDVRAMRVGDELVFTWRDVSDRHAALEASRRAEHRYRLLAENMADVVVQFDSQRRITYVSPSVTDLLGYEPEDLHGLAPQDLVHKDDLDAVTAALPLPDTGEREGAVRARVRHKDGSYTWVSRTAKPLHDDAGRVVGGVATWRDAEDDVRVIEELAERARTDPLTGVLTRRDGWHRLHADLNDQRSGQLVAVLFCDLDGFGDVNRRHGHQAGDAVLCAVADRLRSSIRDTDYVIRVGGDEMVVVLNGMRDLVAALSKADNLRLRIAAPVAVDGEDVTVTASIGAALAEPGETVSGLVDRADRAMFRAKAAGKNQVVTID